MDISAKERHAQEQSLLIYELTSGQELEYRDLGISLWVVLLLANLL